MSLTVYSKSASFESHLSSVIEGGLTFRSVLSPPVAAPGNVYLVHAASFVKELPEWLEAACQKGAVIAVVDDNPLVTRLLTYTQAGVSGYCNTYMSAPNYAQMVRLLSNHQSWFPPSLLAEAFDLARSAVRTTDVVSDPLEVLTKREREVALAVAEGKSNKLIANQCDISERTVKSHLTHIFKKLEIKDRVALVIYLKQSDFENSATHLG